MATKREIMRQLRLENALCNLSFTSTEAYKLRRISLTLQRWHELECGVDNGGVERDPDTNKTFWRGAFSGKTWAYPDRETGALKRLGAIINARNGRSSDIMTAYVQTDPRGNALYILRPGDVPEGKQADCYYSRGIAVY